MKRKIAVITGSRAEYGLLYWLVKDIQQDPDLELQLIVTGMHLSPEFGNTVSNIEQDGFNPAAKIEMLISADTPTAITKSMGLGLIGFADSFANLQPDIVLLLGDRFEIFVAAQAAMIARIPIAHIHGGELTEGANDDAMRHSITKLSHLHFVASEVYRHRVIQLGEQPAQVFVSGAPGLDHLHRTQLLDRKALAESLNFNLGEGFFLITYHPETLSDKAATETLHSLLSVLDKFPQYQLIITYPNADHGGRALISELKKYAVNKLQRVFLTQSLGQLRYLSALKHAALVIGNSSSGLIEAPSFDVPTVNIGNRQKGRLRANSVIDCDDTSESINKAINHALSEAFQKDLINMQNPYGTGHSSTIILNQLKKANLAQLINKQFYDLNDSKQPSSHD